MLSKARKANSKPYWIGEGAWDGLQAYWNGVGFKQISSQNKVNRASARGGAVHTTGRKSHLDVALELVCFLAKLILLFIMLLRCS